MKVSCRAPKCKKSFSSYQGRKENQSTKHPQLNLKRHPCDKENCLHVSMAAAKTYRLSRKKRNFQKESQVESQILEESQVESKVESQQENQEFYDRHIKKYSRMRRHGKKLLDFIEGDAVSERLQKTLFTYGTKKLRLEVRYVQECESSEEESD